jgi:hypothetical protein
MNVATKYVLILVSIVATVMAGLVIIFGWTKFIDAVGGLKSFGGLVALILMLIVLIATLAWLMLHNYHTDQGALDGGEFARDIIVATIIMVILGAIGYNWIDLPSGAGMKVAAVVALCAIASIITTWIGRIDEP